MLEDILPAIILLLCCIALTLTGNIELASAALVESLM